MGPVNLIAIEEYRELKERHAFLSEQSDDLWKSKEQLLAAIDDINKTSQEMFQETFEKDSGEFFLHILKVVRRWPGRFAAC